PYTQFTDRLAAVLVELAGYEAFGIEETLDAIGYMLRHLCRHLTAFDLTLFHNFGANYPDALFLDLLLKTFLHLVGNRPAALLDAAAPRRRRRALRQACLVRAHYEGHRVPDAPTSLGEAARVLPEPFVRVPQEQIFEAATRTRELFAGE